MFRLNTDTVLLGEWMKVKKGESVLDIGCNNGALLLYASRFSPKSLCGIDVLQPAIDLAAMNMEKNHLEAELICQDVSTFHHEPFDVIVCNPPYFRTTDAQSINDSLYLATARHEDSCTLDSLFTAAGRLLKDKGRFYMVHRASRMAEILVHAENSPVKVREATLVYDRRTRQATAVLLQLRKGKTDEIRFNEPIWMGNER